MNICANIKKIGLVMQSLGRKKIIRHIEGDHRVCFKPCGVRGQDLEKTELDFDEMEAIRLSDYEGLYQQECADKMGISRTTFQEYFNKHTKKFQMLYFMVRPSL